MQLLKKYWLAIFVILSVAYVGYYLAHETGRFGSTLRVSTVYVILTCAIQILFWFLASHLWRNIVNNVSGKKLSLLDSFSQLCLVNLGKYLPGKVWGMIARGSHMKLRHGISVEHAVQATYQEQFFLLLSGGVVMVLLASYYADNLLGWWFGLLMAGGVALGAYFNERISSFLGLLYRTFTRQRRTPPAVVPLSQRRYYYYLLSYMLVWVTLGLVFVGLYLAFFVPPLSLTLVAALVLASTAGFSAGFVAVFAPGGIGVREAVTAAILAGYMAPQDAVLLSVLFRLWTIFVEVIIGSATVLLVRGSTQGNAHSHTPE